ERQCVAIEIDDRELALAVERVIDVLREARLRICRLLAGEDRARALELAALEQLIDLVDAVGLEPEAHLALRGGSAAGYEHDEAVAERQAGPRRRRVELVLAGQREADRLVPRDRGAHVGDPHGWIDPAHARRDRRQLRVEAGTAGGLRYP